MVKVDSCRKLELLTLFYNRLKDFRIKLADFKKKNLNFMHCGILAEGSKIQLFFFSFFLMKYQNFSFFFVYGSLTS